LPAEKITTVKRQGKIFFVDPDPGQKQLFISPPAHYQDFRTRREIERNDAADNAALQKSLREARTDSSADWNHAWGSWTGTGGY